MKVGEALPPSWAPLNIFLRLRTLIRNNRPAERRTPAKVAVSVSARNACRSQPA